MFDRISSIRAESAAAAVSFDSAGAPVSPDSAASLACPVPAVPAGSDVIPAVSPGAVTCDPAFVSAVSTLFASSAKSPFAPLLPHPERRQIKIDPAKRKAVNCPDFLPFCHLIFFMSISPAERASINCSSHRLLKQGYSRTDITLFPLYHKQRRTDPSVHAALHCHCITI